VPFGTNVTNLVPTITHTGISLSPGSGVTQNFTGSVNFTVAAEDSTQQTYAAAVLITQNSEALMTSFSLPGALEVNISTTGTGNETINILMPFGTDVSNLIASFTASVNAVVKINNVVQISGVTANNFTSPKLYKIISEDSSTTVNYTTTVAFAQNTEALITSFTFPGSIETIISTTGTGNETIKITMPFGTDLTSLVSIFTASENAVVKVGSIVQVSGVTSNNFTSTIIYKIISEDGSITTNYVVSVILAQNTEAFITAFTLPGSLGTTISTTGTGTENIVVTMPFDADVSNLIATFSASVNAVVKIGSVIQTSGITANNFTSPLNYKLVSEDGNTTTNYIVTVLFALNPEALITAFSLPGSIQTTISTTGTGNETINILMPFDTDVSNLIASFTASQNATVKVGNVVQVSGVTPNNFTSPLLFQVISEDGSTTVNYTTTVAFAQNTEALITSFTFPGSIETIISTTGTANETIKITMPFGTDLTSLVAIFTASENAIVKIGNVVQESDVTSNNFTSNITFQVTSEDGNTTTNYVVSVLLAQNTEALITAFYHAWFPGNNNKYNRNGNRKHCRHYAFQCRRFEFDRNI